MARYTVDDGSLSIFLDLDQEGPEVDLTADGLGDEILDQALAELKRCHGAGTDPDGAPWAPNRDLTVRAKGHDRVGFKTGALLGTDLQSGPRDVQPRSLSWTWPGATGKELSFHQGVPARYQEPRPLVGWTAQAQARADELLAAAAVALAGDQDPDEIPPPEVGDFPAAEADPFERPWIV